MQSSLHLAVRPGFWRTTGSASLRACGPVRAGCWRTTGSNSLRAAGPVRAGFWRTFGSNSLRAAGPVGAGCLRATGSAILRAAGPVGRPQASGRHQAPTRHDQARGPRGDRLDGQTKRPLPVRAMTFLCRRPRQIAGPYAVRSEAQAAFMVLLGEQTLFTKAQNVLEAAWT